MKRNHVLCGSASILALLLASVTVVQHQALAQGGGAQAPRFEANPLWPKPLGNHQILGSVTGVAEAKGVRPGMRLGEALATCPELELVEQDPATAEQAWEEILRRLEDAGFAVEPAEPKISFSMIS